LTLRVNGLIAALERRGITSESEIGATLERFLAGASPPTARGSSRAPGSIRISKRDC